MPRVSVSGSDHRPNSRAAREVPNHDRGSRYDFASFANNSGTFRIEVQGKRATTAARNRRCVQLVFWLSPRPIIERHALT